MKTPITTPQPLALSNPYHPMMAVGILYLLYSIVPGLLAGQSAIVVGVAIPVLLLVLLGRLCKKNKLSVFKLLGVANQQTFSEQARSLLLLLLACTLMLIGFSNVLALFQIPAADPARFVPKTPEGLSILSLAILPALSEELIFRGYIQSVVSHGKPNLPLLQIVLPTLIFVTCHGYYAQEFAAIVYVGLMGALLSYWRYRSQSILPGMIAHMLNNSLVIALAG